MLSQIFKWQAINYVKFVCCNILAAKIANRKKTILRGAGGKELLTHLFNVQPHVKYNNYSGNFALSFMSNLK
jgi:hypothetical protein